MELEEIYSLTIAPPVVSRFAIEWSQDDHISILTENGVHILEFIPFPMSSYSIVKFSRSFIYAPSTLPTENTSSKLEAKIWGMKREELYSLMMEESLTPKLCNLKEMVPKITDLAWSPRNLIHPSKCLVAILTSAGAVTIAYKISNNWYPLHDLSSLRSYIADQELNSKSRSKKNTSYFNRLRNSLKSTQACSFAWSKLFVDFAYLAVAYYNGDIVIYKIARVTNCNKISEPKIAGTINLNCRVKITTLRWITIEMEKHLLIVGYFDGRIYGLKIRNRDQKMEMTSVDKYYDYADRIPVNATRIFPESESDVRMLIAKGNFIFVLRFSGHGNLTSMEHMQMEGFTVSGMICTSANEGLITTENGSMFTIQVEENRCAKTELYNKLTQGNLRYLGLAQSPNAVIFLNVTSPGTVYDHLVLKEPSKMYMFCIKNETCDPLLILMRSENAEHELLWDCLEALRIKATKASDPLTTLSKFAPNLETLSLHELRIAMWISLMIEISDKKTVIQGIGSIAGEISDAQPLIFVYTTCNYLVLLMSKSSLSEMQKLSMSLLKMYLQVYLAEKGNVETSPICKRAKEVLTKVSRYDLNDSESCNLCGEKINDFPWKITKCTQGHVLPRCAITLLQITGVRYRTCPICGLIFHPCLEEDMEEIRCLFCYVPAIEENRLVDSKFYISMEKSLSKRRGNILEASEDRDAETAADKS